MAGENDTGATPGGQAGQFGEQMMGGARRATEAMRDAGGKIAETGQTLSMRALDHAEENTREAFAAMRAAAAARDPGEVMRIQGEYLREQGSRSMSQAREIGELIVSLGKTGMASMTGGAKPD